MKFNNSRAPSPPRPHPHRQPLRLPPLLRPSRLLLLSRRAPTLPTSPRALLQPTLPPTIQGGATLSAGRLVAEDGVLKTFSTPKVVWPHSGHYLPTEENFEELMSFLMENNVDLTDTNPEEDGMGELNQDIFLHNLVEAMKPPNTETESPNLLAEKLPDLKNEDSNAHSTSQPPSSKLSVRLG
ncbi:hypothetical protein VNO80_14285 [Phaseolus coccineus]|uniref:Uncharacterized protein n=1 Tax=Phaseolus coccineus TaxID=3886 RepID=A0AAN9QY98_PHACN